MRISLKGCSIELYGQAEQIIFSDALAYANSQTRVDPLPPGHLAIEEKARGSRYVRWRRHDVRGKPSKPIYVGVANGPEHQVAQDQLDELNLIRNKAKSLRGLGYATEDQPTSIVLAQLHNEGLFQGGGVLVGTRAFRALVNLLGFRLHSRLSTMDIDIARHERIVLSGPESAQSMSKLLKATGLSFFEVPRIDRKEPSTSWKVRGKDLMVDLLVPARSDAESYSSKPIPELQAYGTALKGLDYLVIDSVSAMVIGKHSLIPVQVPSPSRFVWHKIAVSTMRRLDERPKAEKDLIQAAVLAIALYENGDVDDLYDAAQTMPEWMHDSVIGALPRMTEAFGLSSSNALEELHHCLGISPEQPKI